MVEVGTLAEGWRDVFHLFGLCSLDPETGVNMTMKQLVQYSDSYLMASWDKVSVLAAGLHNILTAVDYFRCGFAKGAKSDLKPMTPGEMHPFRREKRKRGINVGSVRNLRSLLFGMSGASSRGSHNKGRKRRVTTKTLTLTPSN